MEQNSPNFSLVVLDECHKNKRESGVNQFTDPEEVRNFDAEKLVCSSVHTQKVLGLTASPLGIDERDVQIISEKIGIPENLYDFFKHGNTIVGLGLNYPLMKISLEFGKN